MREGAVFPQRKKTGTEVMSKTSKDKTSGFLEMGFLRP